jgi:hypothetical protein
MGQDPTVADAAAAGGAFVFVMLYIAILVFVIAGGWKMLSKGGLMGVAILVPFWNAIALAQLAQKPWWWGLLTLIPFVGIVFAVLIMHGISTAFGRGVGTTIGLVLLFPIFACILGFGSAQYQGKASGFE